jgi:flagellar hook-associated protein 2
MAAFGSIDGIISGLDTTSIIENIINFEHRQVDIYLARQAEYAQKLTTWQTINSFLLAFKTQADVLSKPTLWGSKTVTSSDESKIVATANNSSAIGTYFISVDQLAQNQQIASQGYSSGSAILGLGTVDISVAGGAVTTITLEAGQNSLESLKNAINDAGAGITAAIVNDGSSNAPYRLILTSNQTGADNVITINSNLTGGEAPDFTTSYFDVAEKIDWSSEATSNPSLGSTADYTGNTNKTYLFTVQGTGAQTIGGGPITLDWTDGTNSGTITVNNADQEVALTGDGADGLTVSFSAGDLVGGDTFQIQASAPVIQAGQDAILRLGAGGSGGSPIIVTSPGNTVTSLIDGVTLEIKGTTTEPVQITVEQNNSSILSTIQEFVNKYNEFADFVDQQLDYNSDTGTAGVLLGETSLMNLLSDVRSSVLRRVSGLVGDLTKLSDIGIKFNFQGKLELDSSILTARLEDDPDEVRRLLQASGSTDNGHITFLSSGIKAVPTSAGYDVDITQASLQGMLEAGVIDDPGDTNLVLTSGNNNIQIKINGLLSSVLTLEEKTYTSGNELAQEIEDKINSDEALGSNDVEVAWVDQGTSGYLQITSTIWGANSKVEIDTTPSSSAHNVLGFSNGVSSDGQDVQGTINGETATGVGQILTGDDDNDNTAGLKLKISLTPDQVIDGPEGMVYLTKGIAAILSEKIDNYTDASVGILSSRTKSITKQIDNLKEQIDRMEEQLERKRASLYREFIAMEEALGKLQGQQMYLSAAIASMNRLSASSSGGSSFYGI